MALGTNTRASPSAGVETTLAKANGSARALLNPIGE